MIDLVKTLEEAAIGDVVDLNVANPHDRDGTRREVMSAPYHSRVFVFNPLTLSASQLPADTPVIVVMHSPLEPAA